MGFIHLDRGGTQEVSSRQGLSKTEAENQRRSFISCKNWPKQPKNAKFRENFSVVMKNVWSEEAFFWLWRVKTTSQKSTFCEPEKRNLTLSEVTRESTFSTAVICGDLDTDLVFI